MVDWGISEIREKDCHENFSPVPRIAYGQFVNSIFLSKKVKESH